MKNKSLEHFKGIKVKIQYEPIIHKYSGKTQKILETTSPKSGRAGRETPYFQGWAVDTVVTPKGYKDVVWNKTNWQLTHLLENGHFIKNRQTLSWSAPRKHIKPAYLTIRDPYVNAMKKVDIDVDFK